MTTSGLVVALLLAQGGPAAPATPAAPAARPPVAEAASLPLLTLDQAYRAARAGSYDLKVAQERLAQSKELHWKAWSAYLPQVNAGATFTHNNFSDVTFQSPTGLQVAPNGVDVIPTGVESVVIQKQDQWAGQIQANVPLLAPQAWFGIAAARAQERVAEHSTEQARQDILFGVAQAYYAAAGLKQVAAIQERQLAIAAQHEQDARVRYEAGTAPKITLLRAQIDRTRAERDLKRAQNSYLAGKVSLGTLIGRPDAQFEVEEPPPPQPPPGDADAHVALALHDRADVRASEEQVSAATRSRNADRARYLPTVGAFGRYVYSNASGFSGDEWTWAVGLSLNWTILDGFLRESDLRQDAARIREAEASRAGLQLRARDDVLQARLDLDSAVANRDKAKEQLDLARENQRLVDVNYKAGAATYLEVTDANAALLQAELSQVAESLSADLAALRVIKAVGAFSPT